MSKKYIAIAGNMGSGKSSLVKFLCQHFGLKPFFEPNDINPFLVRFYKDMHRWAFHSQMSFLTQKYRIHQELDNHQEPVIQDRTIYEDAQVYAKHLFLQKYMDKQEHETYTHMYENFVRTITPPDLMIYLECPLRMLRKRIKMRGRKMEMNIPDSYITSLEKLYKSWISKYKRSPVIVYSTEKIDYMSDFIHRADLLETISKHL